MSKIMIGKKECNVEEAMLNQCELLFYEENPRVYSILRSNGTVPTQKEIERKLKTMEHVKQLRLSIEQNGGVIGSADGSQARRCLCGFGGQQPIGGVSSLGG